MPCISGFKEPSSVGMQIPGSGIDMIGLNRMLNQSIDDVFVFANTGI